MNLVRGAFRALLFATLGAWPSTLRAQTSHTPAQAVPSTSPAANVDTHLTFDVVTIKPGDPDVSRGTYFRVEGRHLIAANVSLFDLLSLAYSLHASQIVNGPRWLNTNRYDIDGVPALEARPNLEQQRLLFRSLLSDRYHLVSHYEQRKIPVYALVLETRGPTFAPTTRQPQDATNFSYTKQIVLTVKNASMATFADGMQATFMDRPVIDRTGLTGRYDFTLRWTPDDSAARDTADAPPNLYTAIKEQLGLKFVPVQASAKALVVDHVEAPSAN